MKSFAGRIDVMTPDVIVIDLGNPNRDMIFDPDQSEAHASAQARR